MVVQKTVVVGAGPVGALAAIYAARRGDEVEIYELRGGEYDCDQDFLTASSSFHYPKFHFCPPFLPPEFFRQLNTTTFKIWDRCPKFPRAW